MQRRTFLTTSAATAAITASSLGLPEAAWAQTAPATPPLPAAGALPPPAFVAESVPGALFGGSARMRFLGFEIYDAALWVAPGFQASKYAQSPLILDLRYLRGLYGSAIAKRSISEMRRAGSFNAEQEQRWLAAMEASFPDVKEGDRITGVHNPVSGARFWFNGLARAPINDPEFSRLFFGIWLSSATSEPKLRTALLANLPQ